MGKYFVSFVVTFSEYPPNFGDATIDLRRGIQNSEDIESVRYYIYRKSVVAFRGRKLLNVAILSIAKLPL